MKGVSFSYEHSFVSIKDISRLTKKLAVFQKELRDSASHGYHTKYAALNTPSDHEIEKYIEWLVHTIRSGKPELLVVVGIGGSNLGTMAVHQIVKGKLSNDLDRDLKVLYADTVDADEIADVKRVMEQVLKSGKKVVLNCVTKSGTTIETLANFMVLLDVLKRYDSNYKKSVVITTDLDSNLAKIAQEEGYFLLPIPSQVGGRYSVLTGVSLFPLALAGISVRELLSGALAARKEIMNSVVNSASKSACVRYIHARKGHTIQDLFLFGNDFKSLGKWYRQLYAESLGKGCNSEGKLCLGITPSYSIGTTDMHSIAQLYLGGPFDKFTTFVSVTKNKEALKVPSSEFGKLLPYLKGKRFESIMGAVYAGVLASFAEKKRPFTEFIFSDKSPQTIGYFLYLQMVEVMYLAHLLGVNPFDQPDIESYKEATRQALSR